jgi:hypothetical protein
MAATRAAIKGAKVGGKALKDAVNEASEWLARQWEERQAAAAETIEGVHYSNNTDTPLRELDGAKYGTGTSARRGAERGRVEAGDPAARDRSYFYPVTDTPVPKSESMVGGAQVYRGRLDGMYNLDADPLNLKGPDHEARIKAAGFKGFHRPSMGMAVNLQPSTPVELLSRDGAAGARRMLADEQALPRDPWMVTAEVLPSTETEMGQWLAKKAKTNPGLVARYTDDVTKLLTGRNDMRAMGAEGSTVRQGYGGYEGGDANPNIVVRTPDRETAERVGKSLGYVTQQDAVPFLRLQPGDVGDGPAGVRVKTEGGLNAEQLAALRRGTGADYTRTDLDTVDFVNFRDDEGTPLSGLSDNDFVDKISRFFVDKPVPDGLDIDAIRAQVSPEFADEVERYVLRGRSAPVASSQPGVGKIRETSEVRADPTGSYNWTQDLWKGAETAPDIAGVSRQHLNDARRRIEAYDTAFRKQHGRSDPRALAALAGIGTALAAAPAVVEAGPLTAGARRILDERFLGAVGGSKPRAGLRDATETMLTEIEQREMDTGGRFSLQDFEGQPYILTQSDRSAAGGRIVGVDGKEIDSVDLRGGRDFMFDHPSKGMVWASDLSVVSPLQRRAAALKAETGESPILLPYAMAPTGIDFATMPLDLMVNYARSTMSKANIKKLDAGISTVVPNWTSVADPTAGAVFRDVGGDQRKAIAGLIDKQFRDVRGGMSISEARAATSDAAQYTAPTGQMTNIGRIDPDRPVLAESGHPTYRAGLPGEGVGRFDNPLDVRPFMAENGRVLSGDSADFYALSRNPALSQGVVNESLLRRIYGNATPDMMGTLAAGATATALAPLVLQEDRKPPEQREYDQRVKQRRGRYAGQREAIAQSANTTRSILDEVGAALSEGFGNAAKTIGNSSSIMFDALDMPMRGLYGAATTAGMAATGSPTQSALDEGVRVIQQPLDQTAYDMGGYVTDVTGSPAAGTAAYLAALLTAPTP